LAALLRRCSTLPWPSRPRLRRFEIPFLGISGAPDADQILPSELLVSVAQGRVALWSRRLGKEVVPRLSCPASSASGLAVVRFLGALQDQDGGSGGWDWGPLKDLPFLPRVVRGRQVLCRAQWRLERAELERALEEAAQGVREAFDLIRSRRGLPRMVVFEDGDDAFLVDLEQPLWAEALGALVAGRDAFTLLECFPDPSNLPLRGPEGRFTHELVVAFQCAKEPRPALRCPEEIREPRFFPPGSEWLYAKIYCGPATADRVLLEGVAPLVEATRGLWDKWFFLRFGDPDPHLHLWFHGHPDRMTGDLLPWLFRMLEPLRRAGLWWRLQLDTYERELERYGGPPGLALAEDWFWRDSEQVLDDLAACRGEQGAQLRLKKAVAGAERILDALGLEQDARTRLTLLKDASPALEAFQGQEPAPVDPRNPSMAALLRVVEAAHSGRLAQPLEALAPALTRLHLNRLLRSEQRVPG